MRDLYVSTEKVFISNLTSSCQNLVVSTRLISFVATLYKSSATNKKKCLFFSSKFRKKIINYSIHKRALLCPMLTYGRTKKKTKNRKQSTQSLLLLLLLDGTINTIIRLIFK